MYRLTQKITIGLSASIAFKIVNQSEYALLALGLYNYDYSEKITSYLVQ